MMGQRVMALNCKRVGLDWILGRNPYCEGGEALESVAKRNCACAIPRSVQGQVRWGFEQPGLVRGVLACSRWVGTR